MSLSPLSSLVMERKVVGDLVEECIISEIWDSGLMWDAHSATAVFKILKFFLKVF